MHRSLWSLAVVATVVAVTFTGCSSDSAPTVLTVKDLSCDQDRTSIEARSAIERVGGLAGDDYVVHFAQSTRLGIVALVDGDTQQAFDELHGTYDVALVAQIQDDDDARVTGFEQLQELVKAACG